MRVYVVAGYRKSEIWFSSEETEDWPTQYRVIDVFESEADAETFCAENKGDGWRYTIFGKDVIEPIDIQHEKELESIKDKLDRLISSGKVLTISMKGRYNLNGEEK